MTSAAAQGLLLDTNVLLDYCLPNRPDSKTSFQLIDVCVKQEIPLYCAATSLTDVFYIVERAIRHAISKEGKQNNGVSHEIAWGVLSCIENIVQVVGVDASDVWLATKNRTLHNDFEDNVIVAAAMRANAKHLVTNDARLKDESCVSALRPSQVLALIDTKIPS